jgi:dTDP-4-amino-4,6-dideoxygalactose transaminase
MTSRAFSVVELFEEAMAEFAGAKYGVAVDSCTSAIFLSLVYDEAKGHKIFLPARTYISVAAAVVHAGATVEFVDAEWKGVYGLFPTRVVDGALRMQRGMYQGGLHCVSFHARKHLRIGRGGMVLTDDEAAAAWLRKARFDGRNGSVPFMEDPINFLGWNAYMTPEQAARGLQQLETLPPDLPDLTPDYPDLRKLPVFQEDA